MTIDRLLEQLRKNIKESKDSDDISDVEFKGVFEEPKAGEKLLEILKNRSSNYKIIKPLIYMYDGVETIVAECLINANYKGRNLEFYIKCNSFYSRHCEIEISIKGRESDRALIKEIFEELWKECSTVVNIEFNNIARVAENLHTVVSKLAKNYKLIEPKFSYSSEGGRLVFKEGTIFAEFEDGILKFKVGDRWQPTISVMGSAKKSMEKIFKCINTSDTENLKPKMFKKVKLTGLAWEDVGGLEELKEELRDAIELPLANPTLFKKLGIKPPKGIILYGKPGTGKTLLAKVIACCSKANFFYVTAADLTSAWYGESEKRIVRLFEEAKADSPALIFIDEIDGLFTERDMRMHEATRRMLGVFLEQLDGLKELSGVTVLAATNKLEDLDKAMIRPGRFDRIIEVPLPDLKAREEIFKIHTRGMPLKSKINFAKLAEMTEGFSGADIETVCQKAAYKALARYKNANSTRIEELSGDKISKIKISEDDFLDAIRDKLKSQEIRNEGSRIGFCCDC